MKDKIRTLIASCLCNGVSMKITGEFRPVINCHCIQCTKLMEILQLTLLS